MAMVMESQQVFKHYCRVCNKSFGCGRALGGHMRAHGVAEGDAAGYDKFEWESDNAGIGTKRMYALRANTTRLRSCRVCENCGEEFSSWKLFLDHGRCNSDDDEPPAGDEEEDVRCGGWSTGQRTRRAKFAGAGDAPAPETACPSSEDEELASCLVLLSAARAAEAPSSSDSGPHRAPCADEEKFTSPATTGKFECKACKKTFASHQALGGHRASHKRVKGCYAAADDEAGAAFDVTASALTLVENSELEPPTKKTKLHECSICRRVFASGQALGGHKRCHWMTAGSPEVAGVKFLPLPENQVMAVGAVMENSEVTLDLNLPARPAGESRLAMPAAAAAFLRRWIDDGGGGAKVGGDDGGKGKGIVGDVDDVVESRVKLSCGWLQVGIGSSANGGSDHNP